MDNDFLKEIFQLLLLLQMMMMMMMMMTDYSRSSRH